MKKLYILRHAKAGKSNKKILDDHERPLTRKGLNSCKLIAAYLRENKEKPEVVICSTALRTRKTFENVFKDYLPKLKAEFEPRLYLASTADIFSLVNETDDAVKSLMVIGHNPSLHEFSLQLMGEGERPLVRKLKDCFPPGALAIYEIAEKSWSDVGRKSGNLSAVVIPKNLTPED